jgi:heme o synthase
MRKTNKPSSNLLSAYLILTKPGIIIGNTMVAMGAFIYASDGTIDLLTFFSLLVGTVCIIAASCVVNNYLDKDIDAHMSRTAIRPSVTGLIPLVNGMLFSGALAVLGFTVLLLGTNMLTAAIGVVGAVIYAAVYTPLKHISYHATLVGAIPGAVPPLAGFVAAQGYIDLAAWLVFAVLIAWQMPHFYAIAVFRRKDYAAASVPTIVAVKGLLRTIIEIRLYIVLFIGVLLVMGLIGMLGIAASLILAMLGLYWLYTALRSATDATAWARTVFRVSLLALPALSILLATDRWLP